MASNSFGNLFRITTFGESHGSVIGVVIDGCPSKIKITEEEINLALSLRQPGKTDFVSPRVEEDKARIVSGVFSSQTTGAPIAILIENHDVDSSKYEDTKNLLKPGHANFTYLEKYGVYDYRGGGRASARETACRVAAGSIAAKILEHFQIKVCAYINSIGTNIANIDTIHINTLKERTIKNPIYCPDNICSEIMMANIKKAQIDGDSLGGIVGFVIDGLPSSLGDPVYEKFSANLANAMFSIPSVKGFELGEGFTTAKMRGSEHNDAFICDAKTGKITLASNHCGGTLGGITTGTRVNGRVAFKPTPSIRKPQKTIDTNYQEQVFKLPKDSRHDPCTAIRGVIVVEAMCNLVIADALLMNQSLKLD